MASTLEQKVQVVDNFISLMDRVGDTIDELKYPSMNSNLTKEDIIDLLKEVHSFYKMKNIIVEGDDITEIDNHSIKAENELNNVSKSINELDMYSKSEGENECVKTLKNEIKKVSKELKSIRNIIKDI